MARKCGTCQTKRKNARASRRGSSLAPPATVQPIAGGITPTRLPGTAAKAVRIVNHAAVRVAEVVVVLAEGPRARGRPFEPRPHVPQQARRDVEWPDAPAVGVTMLADSSINIALKPWTSVADYAAAQTEIYQDIIEQFRTNNVQIPFPQRDVRMITNPA